MGRVRGGMAVAAALLFTLAGCAGSDTLEARLRVVVPDGQIRSEGVECAGARPYRHIHAGVPFTLEGGDGSILAEGELPPGRAENADPSIDWEELERIPTVCVMEFTIGDLAEHPSYQLSIEGTRPLPFDASHLTADSPIVLVITQ